MRSLSPFHVFHASLALLVIVSAVPGHAAMSRVERVGRIGVGDSIEGFPKICAERHRLEARGVKVRRAFYFLRPGLPGRCINLQCGVFARQILAHGGILVGGAEAEYARELGLADDVRGSEATAGAAPAGAMAGTSGRVPPALLVVTDLHGRVQALFKDASPADLPAILRSLDR